MLSCSPIHPRYKHNNKPAYEISSFSFARKQEFEKNIGPLHKLSCCVCASEKFRRISDTDRYGFYCPVGICIHCGHVQQEWVYSPQTMRHFYESFYRDIYGYLSPRDFFEEQRREGQRIHDSIQAAFAAPGAMLEVGAGAGGILSVFQDNNWDAVGLDLNSHYLEYGRSRGIELVKATLSEVFSDRQFDLIILSHVLEHVTNPSEMLQQCVSRLSAGGKIWIEVPSIHIVRNRYYKSDLLRYLQNAHVSYFSSGSLVNLLSQNGLGYLSMDKEIAALVVPMPRQISRKNCFRENWAEVRRIERTRPFFQLREVLRNCRRFFKWGTPRAAP
jgi:2-polyprenyl-3-methyl-5-hydroxy-6-metoxy-1,4-benzoquinol methylase